MIYTMKDIHVRVRVLCKIERIYGSTFEGFIRGVFVYPPKVLPYNVLPEEYK